MSDVKKYPVYMVSLNIWGHMERVTVSAETEYIAINRIIQVCKYAYKLYKFRPEDSTEYFILKHVENDEYYIQSNVYEIPYVWSYIEGVICGIRGHADEYSVLLDMDGNLKEVLNGQA